MNSNRDGIHTFCLNAPIDTHSVHPVTAVKRHLLHKSLMNHKSSERRPRPPLK